MAIGEHRLLYGLHTSLMTDMNGKKTQYVQYGCGPSGPKSWRNFDASPTLRFERIPLLGKLYIKNNTRFGSNIECGDIVKGLPFPPNTVNGVYASHVLEHLGLHDFRIALRNTHKILRPNGIFRLVVPDLKLHAENYARSEDPLAAVMFMKNTSLGINKKPRTLFSFLKFWLGNSSHLSMWDFNSLKHELLTAGFSNIRRCLCGDSEDRMFDEVDDLKRFIDSVGIECRKPE
jgi:SAM-dependent methyltransferase